MGRSLSLGVGPSSRLAAIVWGTRRTIPWHECDFGLGCHLKLHAGGRRGFPDAIGAGLGSMPDGAETDAKAEAFIGKGGQRPSYIKRLAGHSAPFTMNAEVIAQHGHPPGGIRPRTPACHRAFMRLFFGLCSTSARPRAS